MKMLKVAIATALLVSMSLTAKEELTVEQYCLEGDFNIGARYQGKALNVDEFHPTLWCITYDNQTQTIAFKITGNFNSDMSGENIIKYIPPSTVQLLANNGDINVVFEGAIIGDDALTHVPKQIFGIGCHKRSYQIWIKRAKVQTSLRKTVITFEIWSKS